MSDIDVSSSSEGIPFLRLPTLRTSRLLLRRSDPSEVGHLAEIARYSAQIPTSSHAQESIDRRDEEYREMRSITRAIDLDEEIIGTCEY